MRNVRIKLFRLILGATGICEMLLGLSIIFFATQLQSYFATGWLYEPLNLRILGMMDFFIGAIYFQISRRPDYYRILNKGTAYLRLGLSLVFFAEGFFLLEQGRLRVVYQFLTIFDFFLFAIQTTYLRKSMK